MTDPLFGISGFKNSGKTTLTAGLISQFRKLGLRISAVKHAHHEFDLDQPGTDTDKHRAAGAGEVLISSSKRWALMHENIAGETEPTLSELVSKLAPCDLVLAEGFKNEDHPKLLLISNQEQLNLLSNITNVVAIAAEPELEIDHTGLPRFDRNDLDSISKFILQTFSLRARE